MFRVRTGLLLWDKASDRIRISPKDHSLWRVFSVELIWGLAKH